MKKHFLICILLAGFQLNGQTLVGIGIDAGVRSVGPKIELITLNRIRIETGFTITRFSTYSSNTGIKFAVFNFAEAHAIWIGALYKHKFASTSLFEKNDVFYKYHTNQLNYIAPKLSYSFYIRPTTTKKNHHFLVLELTTQYDIRVGEKLMITPDITNSTTSTALENSHKQYFKGGIGVYASVLFFIGGKRE